MNIKPGLLALAVSASTMVATPLFAASHLEGNKVGQSLNVAATSEFLTRTDPLTRLIEQALNNDASRRQFFAQSQAMRETGIASSTLMDPKLKVGFGGLPVDSLRFDEDPMTNISVGLMQQFERGDTLNLQKKKANQQADGIALRIAARELEIANSMTLFWLELGYQQKAEQVLRENRRLMKEMENFLQTNYSIGKNEAQDLLNAQLQVSKLDEKLQANAQVQRRIISQLSEWLGADWIASGQHIQASNQLNWTLLDSKLQNASSTQHYSLLNLHPMVKIADSAISVSQTQVEIAEQAYTPQFGVEVMYGYRQANNMKGEPASDLVSAFVTMDIPLFTGNRQDRNHAAAQYQVGAAKSQKDVLLAQMNAKVNALLVDKSNLEQRLQRYQNTLLEQSRARTKAVERGYQNNTAQFNDVINAASDELSLELEQQRLITDLNIVKSNLAALLGGFEYSAVSPDASTLTNNQNSSAR